MHHKQTLKWRIITAFFLLSVVLGGCFAAVVYLVVHELETDLFYEHLDQEAQWLINASESGLLVSFPRDIQLYKTEAGDLSELPGYLQGLKQDRSEVIMDDRAFHVIVKTQGNRRYYLVQDQSRFEKMEQAIAGGIILAYFGAMAGALWLGYIIANRVLSPVRHLASQVTEMSSLPASDHSFNDQYSDDEVGQLAGAFETYRQRLQRFLDRERLFTGDVSHELRTPLMVITSTCEVLVSRPGLDSHLQQDIDHIYNASLEMQLLVDVFLMLSRNREGLEKQATIIPCNQIVEEEIEYLKTHYPDSKPINIRLDNNAALEIQGIPPFFRIVIRNLLQNAMHYTPQGHITVTVEKTCIHVEDTGPGIPENLKMLVFERHLQAHDNYNGQGQGLGLSIIKRICDYQNWNISLHPAMTTGSRFTIEFSSSLRAG